MPPTDQPKKRFALEGFDNTHYRRTQRYVNIVTRLYDEAVADIANIAVKEKVDPDKPFSFKDYPRAMKLVEEEITSLSRNITAVVQKGTREEWLYACQKNDEFLKSILDTSKLEKKTLESMQDRNLDALKTFQERKINGMNLSERVWKYNDQFKDQIEQGIDVGLGEGTSAAQLSRDLRLNLNDPDRLFRRVRDKRGNLYLSKNAKAFNPGQGVYRSSAKNAMRLTRTEINMAYRESDHLRWQRLDFVVGFEIKVSDMHQRWLDEYWNKHNPGKIEICDVLTGKYPKWFKFTGWHPQCLCYATPILMNDEEFNEDEFNELKAALYGTEYKRYQSSNEVKDVPDAFKEWIAENAEKQKRWKSTPYFIRDNFKGGEIDGESNYLGMKSG